MSDSLDLNLKCEAIDLYAPRGEGLFSRPRFMGGGRSLGKRRFTFLYIFKCLLKQLWF